MKTLTSVTMFLSLLYLNSSHPAIFMAIILAQTVLLCTLMWMNLPVSWFSYILFLIFLGGLMVLFVYITSLASNEMMKFDTKTITMMIMYSLLAFIAIKFFQWSELKTTTSMSLTKSFSFMYSTNFKLIIALSMIYLLLTLIVVVKISNKMEAPIKNIIFY